MQDEHLQILIPLEYSPLLRCFPTRLNCARESKWSLTCSERFVMFGSIIEYRREVSDLVLECRLKLSIPMLQTHPIY